MWEGSDSDLKKFGYKDLMALCGWIVGAIVGYFLIVNVRGVQVGETTYHLQTPVSAAGNWVYQAEGAEDITGTICPDCGGYLVARGEESSFTGRPVKDGFSYSADQSNPSGHMSSGSITTEESYELALAVVRYEARQRNVMGVGLYWLLIGVLLAAALHPPKLFGRSKASVRTMTSLCLFGAVAFAIAVMADLILL